MQFSMMYQLRSGANEILKTCRRFMCTVYSIPNSGNFDITEETQQKCLEKIVSPLSYLSYPDQLAFKQDWIDSVLYEYKRELIQLSKATKTRMPVLAPKVLPVVPSPVIERYRNKNSFVIRHGVDGNPKTVGLLVGKPKNKVCVCILPEPGVLFRSSHIQVAKLYQEFIRSSPLPPCIDFHDGGYWREIRIRSNQKNQTVATVLMHPQKFTKEQIEEQKQILMKFFQEGPGAECNLHSLYFQACTQSNCDGKYCPYDLLLGEKYLEKELWGRKFDISPESFFQVNTAMAEIMYQTIVDIAKLNKQTTLLDLCCGIGVVSILAAPFVRGTVGVDMMEEAILNARHNAVKNNVFNSDFLIGRVEDKIEGILEDLNLSSNVVTVLNPGRAGVGNKMIYILRSTPQIQKLIYISCQANHSKVIENVVRLLKPETKRTRLPPFTLQKVVPLDMFPQAAHCEVILYFERKT